jgi:glycosyltransferase involved in cell wall biosynthesis
MKLYIQKNNFYSNYLRCQLIGKHLPCEVTFFEEYDPVEAEKHDICLFQSYYMYKSFSPKVKHIWDLDDVLENDEINSIEDQQTIINEMKRCFSSCDGVIFGSDRLRGRYKDWYSGKCMIMDDYIDPCDHEAVNQSKNDGKIRIGFMGSGMYEQEVNELIPIMNDLKKKYPIEFTVIGVGKCKHNLEESGFKCIPYDARYDEFQYLLTSQSLDIAVIYQKPREVMQAKNYLKFAEFSWFGIPVVASEWITGRYVPHRYFKPFDTLKECYRAIEQLIKGDRKKLGTQAMKFVKDNYNLHDRVDTYIKFFKEVL